MKLCSAIFWACPSDFMPVFGLPDMLCVPRPQTLDVGLARVAPCAGEEGRGSGR